MKKLKEISSPLLNRIRVEYEIEHFQKATPKKDDLKKIMAKELKVAEDVLHLKHIFSHFGASKSKVVAEIYKTKEDLNKCVRIKKKKAAEESKGEGSATPSAKPAEKAEKTEEKKEAPKEEKKEEKKE